MAVKSIMPCLWFDTQAEDAANHYVSIFDNSKITGITRYGSEGFEIHGRKEGSVMTVAFELEGREYVALNGGPQFTFDEAVSFQIHCETQDEIDYYSSRLSEGGQEGPCGWLKDKFGLSWQVTPVRLIEMLQDADAAKVARVTKAFLQMKKFDIARLEDAFRGKAA
ncbi:MAG: VOC family protein [Hyphomicrobiales bacterium]